MFQGSTNGKTSKANGFVKAEQAVLEFHKSLMRDGEWQGGHRPQWCVCERMACFVSCVGYASTDNEIRWDISLAYSRYLSTIRVVSGQSRVAYIVESKYTRPMMLGLG